MLLRKKGLILLVALIALFIALIMIFSDKWLENNLENLGSGAVGAKVEIDDLDLSFLKMKLSWDRLQITHPENTMKNALETGKVELDLDFSALLKGKFIVEQMSIRDIMTYTDRETDGALVRKTEKKPGGKGKSVSQKMITSGKETVSREISRIPALKLATDLKKINFSSIKSQIRFRTPEKIDSAKKELTKKIEMVQKDLNDTAFTRQLQDVKQQLKQIDPGKIKKINDLKDKLNDLDRLLRQIRDLKRQYGGKEQRIKNLISELNGIQSKVNQWIEEDFARVKARAQIPELDNFNISQYMLGDRLLALYSNYQKFSGYFKKVKSKLESDKPEKEKPPRLKGQDIHFIAERALPDFWIKKAEISGKTNGDFSASGELVNFSFQPKLTKKPIVLKLEGERKDRASYNLFWLLAGRDGTLRDSAHFALNAIPVRNLDLPEGNGLIPSKLMSAIGDFNVNISGNGNSREAKMIIRLKQPKFEFDKSVKDNKLNQIIQQTFKGINMIDMEIRIRSTGKQNKVAFRSNLDEVLKKQLSNIIGRETKEAEKQLRKDFDAFLGKNKKEFTGWLNKQIEDMNSRYKLNLKQVDDLEQLQKEKKKEIEKEIKKKAGSLINRFIK